jgi:peptidoglycan/LPS O-acetylase OafA/YrhL
LNWSGVNLFFVLSGFLIGGILLDNILTTNFVSVFYARRSFRIIPIYLIVLVIVALILNEHFSRAILAYLVFLQNYYMAYEGHWGISNLGPTWSLAVEEQFYLLMPLVIWFIPDRRLPPFLLSCVLIAPLIRLQLFWYLPIPADFVAMLLPCQMDALCLGVLAAWALRHKHTVDFIYQYRTLLQWVVSLGLLGVIGKIGGNVANLTGPDGPIAFVRVSIYLNIFSLFSRSSRGNIIAHTGHFPQSCFGAVGDWYRSIFAIPDTYSCISLYEACCLCHYLDAPRVVASDIAGFIGS